jgi:hypothetical protein
VLHAVAAEDVDICVVNPGRNGKRGFAQRMAEQVPGRLSQGQQLGHAVELGLCHLKRAERLGYDGHADTSGAKIAAAEAPAETDITPNA